MLPVSGAMFSRIRHFNLSKKYSCNKTLPLKEIEKCVTSGALSGAIYDALVVVAAEKFNAHRIITSNYKDFARLVGKNSGLICLP